MFNIADIKIQLINQSLNILNDTFKKFKIKHGIPYTIIRHDLSRNVKYDKSKYKTVYKNNNWDIHIKEDTHVYEYISEPWIKPSYKVTTFFKHNYSSVTSVFQNITEENYKKLNLHSLTGLGTDQALFSNLLSERQGFLFHGNGVCINGKTYLFTGKSGNGKTTISNMLLNSGGNIFSDDRTIIRKIDNVFYAYSSCIHPGHITKYNHKGIIDGIFFIEPSKNNRVRLINEENTKYNLALQSVIKSFINKDKVSKLLNLTEDFTTIPFYKTKFNLDGEINNIIKELK